MVARLIGFAMALMLMGFLFLPARMTELPELLNLQMPIGAIFARLTMAFIVGAIIGWDREHRNKPAGLRTHILVSLGAATFTLLAVEMATLYKGQQGMDLDPTRMLQGIVSGIGFLGAGSIIQGRGSVKGMTTAAGLWMVGGLGAVCGAGLYGLALIATLFALCTLTLVHTLRVKIESQLDEHIDAG